MAEQTTPMISPCGAPNSGTGTVEPGAGGDGTVEGAGGGQNFMGTMGMMAVFILVFYFFILRPQRKRQKQHETLISGISRGDQVVTVGGFFGTVREVRDDTFLIEIAEGVRVRVLKSAIQTKRVTTPAPEEKKD
ncbi:MAG: preprotein translocase subunit YajC [Synergistaceae bacterium]|nr:preprotein translocase subunit YajC [Synergistaceae bacterium]